MIKFDTIIVGGGLFGEIIAKKLMSIGQDVMIFDCSMHMAGSRPAACLMKPSWFSSMGKDVYKPALELLDDLYDLRTIEFELKRKTTSVARFKTRLGDAYWIDPSTILGRGPRHHARVIGVEKGYVGAVYSNGEVVRYSCKNVVVAAGIWTEHLLPQYKQTGLAGAAFRWKGSKIKQPFIFPWAPYKQLVAFNRGDGMWVSDGTAIKEDNYTNEKVLVSQQRCSNAVGLMMAGAEILIGIRPYAKGHKPCLLEEVEKGLWVASGGAKNGTLAAAHCAHVIAEATC